MTKVNVGNISGRGTLDASDPEFYAESNRPTFLDIHRTDPVYWVDAKYTQSFWNVCRHSLIREIGQDSDLFTTEFGVHLNAAAFEVKDGGLEGSGGLTDALPVALRPANVLDAESHRRLRNPIDGHFRPRAALELEPAVRQAIRGVLSDIEPGLEADFMQTFATRVPLLATTRLLGVTTDRERDFANWANIILESFEPGALPDFAAIGEMVAYFSSEVSARKQTPRDDLITQLTQTELSDDEVVMWCWLLLVAGLETTGNLIGAGLDLLLRSPEAKDRLDADPALIPGATAEMLRMVTPGRYIRRTATGDTTIGGHQVRKGDAVVMNLTVANYDPRYSRYLWISTSTAAPVLGWHSPTVRTAASVRPSHRSKYGSRSRNYWPSSEISKHADPPSFAPAWPPSSWNPFRSPFAPKYLTRDHSCHSGIGRDTPGRWVKPRSHLRLSGLVSVGC